MSTDHADAEVAVERNGGHQERTGWNNSGSEKEVGLAEDQTARFVQDLLHVNGHGHEQEANEQIAERQDQNEERRSLLVLFVPVDECHYGIANRSND